MKKNYLYLIAALLPTLFASCAASRHARMAERNAETVRLWFEEGWNKNRNEDLIERVFSPDWSDGNPLRGDQTDGLDGIRQTVQFYRKAFADSHFHITHLFATDKQVAIRYDVVAVHIGDAFGVPKTGKKFTSSGIVIYEMRDGKIYRSWQELDLMSIIKQLKSD